MRRTISAGFVGLLFGTGIALSGMANPAKVLNFFDIAGTWDPSLAFVMGGALIVTAIGYWFVLRREKPVCETRFHLPTSRKLDVPLIAGSAVFGVGWAFPAFARAVPFPHWGWARFRPGSSSAPCWSAFSLPVPFVSHLNSAPPKPPDAQKGVKP